MDVRIAGLRVWVADVVFPPLKDLIVHTAGSQKESRGLEQPSSSQKALPLSAPHGLDAVYRAMLCPIGPRRCRGLQTEVPCAASCS